MMFKTRKLTAAMLAAGVMSTSMLVSNASAVEVSSTGAGNAVVVPYYTVNEGWQTLLNVSNTSGNSLAVKVRLHEAQNSRDVLDFNLALSPRDVWTAWIAEDEDGRPVLKTEDRSCTIPLSVRDSGAAASELAYSGQFVDHTETDGTIPRLSEGYVEILVMGEDDALEAETVSSRGDTAWYAEHVSGEPRNCDVVQSDFIATSDNWDGSSAIPGTVGSGDPIARGGRGYGPITSPSPLKVNASLVNQNNGIAAGVESLHIKGFGMQPVNGGFGNGENLVTAQQFPWFLEPTIASTDGLWTMTGLEPLETDIGATNVANEWATNPATGASSEWVVTFPTKRFHTDNDANNVQAACSLWRNLQAGGGSTGGNTTTLADFPTAGDSLDIMDANACPLDPFTNRFQAENNGASAINVSYNIWDREEGTFQVTTDGVTISPAPPPEITIDTLIHEANVVKIGRNVEALDSVLGSAIARSVETNQLVSDSQVGWAQMDFQGSVLPVTGFMFKQRDFGDASRNFGQATEHAFDTEGVDN